MNVVVLSGSTVGSKTRTAMNQVMEKLDKHTVDATLIDLADYTIQWSDGRHYLDYDGDTKYVTQTIMDADVLLIGTPVFQASIPGTLKNVFDLLPERAFEHKTVSVVMTAGSSKHYLIVDQQLKPILNYMKAHITQSFVFVEEKDFLNKQIINDDIHFRLQDLVDDTLLLSETLKQLREQKEAEFDF
ncbi:FMN reductase [Bacillaceae bacterium JMAK1]|nr:FMN reductase [Bacillaceae bacterium JMAK1]